MAQLHWRMVPFWARDVRIGMHIINAWVKIAGKGTYTRAS